MKIVKKIYFGGNLSEIPNDGKPFEHIQPCLIDIELIINGEFFYWLVTIEDPTIISR